MQLDDFKFWISEFDGSMDWTAVIVISILCAMAIGAGILSYL